MRLSKLLIRTQRLGEAGELLWAAVRAAPQPASAPLRFQLSLALFLQGQHEAAEALLLQVIELEPEFSEAHICLANCQQTQGKLVEACDALRRVAQLKPEISHWCEIQIEGIQRQKT